MAVAMHTISLGFSCQTRFSLDEFDCNMLRLPFDFNITSRDFLIETLLRDGQNLLDGDLKIFQMPKEKWQGVQRDGILFWHDFPLAGFEVAAGWQEKIPALREKYRYLWDRFRQVLRGDGYKKFYLSNTQANLTDYTASDDEFHNKFALDSDFYLRLREALLHYGVRHFDITFINRNINDADALRPHEAQGEGGLLSRFVGILDLPCHQAVAMSLVPLCHRTSIRAVVGRYSNGCCIEYINEYRAAVYVEGNVWGEIVPYFNGYLMFLNAKGMIWKAALSVEGELKFNNHTRWVKIGS